MAGTVPMITPNSITQMAGLDKRPVYFVSLNGAPAPSVVVKGDAAGADVSITWGSKLMKNVNKKIANLRIERTGIATSTPPIHLRPPEDRQ